MSVQDGFRVDPSALAKLAEVVGRGAEDLAAVRRFAGGIDTAGPFTGLLTMVQPSVETVVDALVTELARAVDLATATSASLKTASSSYEGVDILLVEDVEVVAPSLPEDFTRPDANGYADFVEPQRHLVDPPSYDEMEWRASLESDLLSVTSLVRETIRLLSGVDIFESLFSVASGDWREVRRTADRCRAIGQCCLEVGGNIDAGWVQSTSDWYGNAADGAHAYLGALAAGIESQNTTGLNLYGKFCALAEHAFDFYTVVSGLWSDLIDAAVEAALAATLLEVPGVNAAAAIWGGYKTYRVIDNARKIYDLYNDLKDLVTGIQAATETLAIDIYYTQHLPPLPDAPYDFPGMIR